MVGRIELDFASAFITDHLIGHDLTLLFTEAGRAGTLVLPAAEEPERRLSWALVAYRDQQDNERGDRERPADEGHTGDHPIDP